MIEKVEFKVQDYPSADSPATDPFEGLVEAYYQLDGYITSSNKWFWVREEGKKQRGYQDIDVLAINEREVLIVSVTANLDDKVRYTSDGGIHPEKLSELKGFYERSKEYLRSVKEYSWLMDGSREIRMVLAYSLGSGLANKIGSVLNESKIDLISADEIIKLLKKMINDNEKKGLKTNNQLIKLIQLMLREETK